jgi:DNA-binding MarR family transcriptional regulator
VTPLPNEINNEEIQALDKVWHQLIHAMQKSSGKLWKDKLDGATTLEVSILNIIEIKPDVILKDISELLGIPGSTLTNAIDRLEKRGLIRRAISKRDRRSFGLELTAEGTLAQMEHKKGEAVLWQKILGSFDSAAERRELIRLLGKLVDNLSN